MPENVARAAERSFEGELGPFLGEPRFDMQQVFAGDRFPNVVVATDGSVLALASEERTIAVWNTPKLQKRTVLRDFGEGVASIAAAFHPQPVILRMSDFKSNEYANLVAGTLYEPNEENPMIGWRGASRYYDDRYREAFRLEAEGISGVRAEQLEEAIYEVLDDLKENPVPEEELQKVKNQLR